MRNPVEAPQKRSLPAAAWLAVLGSGLLMIAAIVVVVGQWTHIDPMWKAVGIGAATLVLIALAEQGRAMLPATSRIVAHLAAMLVVPAAIAVAATLGQTWPWCLQAGGVTGLVVCLVQSRRWSATLLERAADAAVVLAAGGAAAVSGVPAPLLVAALAAMAVAAGRRGHAGWLAAAVAVSPIVSFLTKADVGPGTLQRMGLVGPTFDWAAPLAAAMAAVVLVLVADRVRSVFLATIAVLAPVTALSSVNWADAPRAFGFSLVAAAVLIGATFTQRFVGDRLWWRQPAGELAVAAHVGGALLALWTLGLPPTIYSGLTLIVLAVGTVVTVFGKGLPAMADGIFAAVFVTEAAAGVAIVGRFGSIGAVMVGSVLAGVLLFSRRAVMVPAALWTAGVGSAIAASYGSGWKSAVAGVLCSLVGVWAVSLIESRSGRMVLWMPVSLVVWQAAVAATAPREVLLITLWAASAFLVTAVALRRSRVEAIPVAVLGLAAAVWAVGDSGAVGATARLASRFGFSGPELLGWGLGIALLAAGQLLRRLQPANSWIAYAPGLVVLGYASLLPLSTSHGSVVTWKLSLALGVGLSAVIVGAAKRLSCPIVVGTAQVLITVIAGFGRHLAALPVWLWLAVGGVTLLGAAVMIERASKDEGTLGRAWWNELIHNFD